MSRHRLLAVVAVTGAAVVALGAPGMAAWSTPAGSGSSTAQATAVQAPASATAVPTAGSTTTSITVTWTAPGSGPAPAGYRVDRLSPAAQTGICSTGATVRTCTDGGRTPGTTYSYNVVALVSAWNSTQAGASTTTAAATLTLDTLPSPATTRPTFTGACTGTASITVTSVPIAGSTGTKTASTTCASGSYSIRQGGGPNELAPGVTYDASATSGSSTSNTIRFTA